MVLIVTTSMPDSGVLVALGGWGLEAIAVRSIRTVFFEYRSIEGWDDRGVGGVGFGGVVVGELVTRCRRMLDPERRPVRAVAVWGCCVGGLLCPPNGVRTGQPSGPVFRRVVCPERGDWSCRAA